MVRATLPAVAPVRQGPPGALDGESVEALQLVEVMIAGRALLAARAGVSLSITCRMAGWAGGGPATPIGQRQALLTTLAHTLGA